jgi:hypothetical protein
MPLKFPTLHIAESVMNRIMNAAEEIDAREPAPAAGSPPAAAVQAPAPTMPDYSPAPDALGTAMQGAKLDAKLSAPPGAMPPAEPVAGQEPGQAMASIAQGGSALSGLLRPPGFNPENLPQ